MKIGNRHGTDSKARSAPVGGGAGHRVIDKIKTDFHPAWTVGHKGGREPARIDVERGVPGMIDPGCAGKPIFANDLSIKMQCRARLTPGKVGNVRPSDCHDPPPFGCDLRARIGKLYVALRLTRSQILAWFAATGSNPCTSSGRGLRGHGFAWWTMAEVLPTADNMLRAIIVVAPDPCLSARVYVRAKRRPHQVPIAALLQPA